MFSSLSAFHKQFPIIGIDEAGKGEYLLPLSICGVFIPDEKAFQSILGIDIQDSKKNSNIQIQKKASLLKKISLEKKIIYEEFFLNPKQYNEFYLKKPNISQIIAWGTVEIIKKIILKLNERSILNEYPKIIALIDRFSQKTWIEDQFKISNKKNLYYLDSTSHLKENPLIDIHQYPKAEENIAVAAASILAKDRVENYRKIEGPLFYKKLGYSLLGYDAIPSGYPDCVTFIKACLKSISTVLEAENFLKKVTKYHFKTSQEILKTFTPQKGNPSIDQKNLFSSILDSYENVDNIFELKKILKKFHPSIDIKEILWYWIKRQVKKNHHLDIFLSPSSNPENEKELVSTFEKIFKQKDV